MVRTPTGVSAKTILAGFNGSKAIIDVAEEEYDPMRTGTLKWFDEAKGYGFIVPADGGEDIFVRRTAFEKAGLGATQGQRLSFDVARAADGLQATHLALTA